MPLPMTPTPIKPILMVLSPISHIIPLPPDRKPPVLSGALAENPPERRLVSRPPAVPVFPIIAYLPIPAPA